MDHNTKMTLLKADLNMMNPPQERVVMLEQLLSAAADLISQRGIDLTDSAGDGLLQVSYAAWLYRRRMQQVGPGMPEWLRLDLNDRLASGKMR